MLGAQPLSQIICDNRSESAGMDIGGSSKRNLPKQLYTLDSEGSDQRGIVQCFFRKDRSSETSFDQLLYGFGIVGFHRYLQ